MIDYRQKNPFLSKKITRFTKLFKIKNTTNACFLNKFCSDIERFFCDVWSPNKQAVTVSWLYCSQVNYWDED